MAALAKLRRDTTLAWRFFLTFQYKHIPSPLGRILIAAHEEGLTGLWFDQQKHHPNSAAWQQVKSQIWLDQCEIEMKAYFDGGLREFKTPLSVTWGTEFQQSVWQVIKQIPLGETVSYAAVARRLNKPEAFRAVGAAVGRNPWSIVVPCHRVVGANASLTGYAGGLDRKNSLLLLEQACLCNL